MVTFKRSVLVAALTAAILAVSAPVSARQAAQQTGTPPALPDGKVAVINTDVFPEKIAELKQKYDQVESQFKARFEKIQQLAQQMKKIEDDLRTNQSTLSADKMRQMQNDYEDLKRRGTRDETDLHDEVSRALETSTRSIHEKLTKFIGVYAKDRGIVAVFNLGGAADTGLFAFWNPGTDITDDLVAEYNKVNPVAGGASGTGAKPGATPPAKP